MSAGSAITVRRADWAQERDAILAIRYEVFVDEQGVPIEEERDQHDPECVHVLAVLEGRNIGTGRLLPSGKIGRLAVVKPQRGSGVGARLLEYLMNLAREQGFEQVYLDAQVGALAFYERHGFTASGPVFKDAGIDHRRMTRPL